MAENQNTGVEHLLALARNKSRQSRSELIKAIDEFYSDDGTRLTQHDRTMMEDIIRALIHDVEMSVRRTLSIHFAKFSDAPRDLVVLLANDRIEVAHPILIRSEVLRDSELMEIVQHRTMEHQVAIAKRQTLSEQVSDALVKTDDTVVIETLLENPGARLSEETMENLVDKSREVESYQRPLVLRRDISPVLARKLYWGVSAALRVHLLEAYDLDADELDETMESVTKEILGDADTTEQEPARAKNSREKNQREGLIELLENGSVFEFLDRFTEISKLRQQLLRRLIFEPGGEGLAILCKALGLSAKEFGRIFIHFRSGRLGEKVTEQNETSTAITLFRSIEKRTAARILARWRRDQDYLNALRMVEERGPSRTSGARRSNP